MNKDTIIGTIPAANELHKVPGFDPKKYLRRTVNEQGESVISLEPRYQRLWFRLACPKGRMLLNPLRITDQLAIFEAKVFFHRDDPTPVSSFTSNKTAQENPNYIRAAQDEALKEALDNAGFGIQLCDMTQAAGGDDGRGPSFLPVQAGVVEPAEKKPAPSLDQNNQPQAQEPAAAPAHAEDHVAPQMEVETPPAAHVQEQEPPAADVPAKAAQPAAQEAKSAPVESPPVQTSQDAPDTAPQEAADSDDQQSVLTMLNFSAPAENPPAPQEAAAAETADSDTARGQTETPAQAAPGYTNDMPMEEILPLMTMEEARAVMAPNGTCTGWTMGQVAERRPSSLRFFLTSFSKCGSIQKAAATLLLRDLEQKKAG